jgi:hypothetical protein
MPVQAPDDPQEVQRDRNAGDVEQQRVQVGGRGQAGDEVA